MSLELGNFHRDYISDEPVEHPASQSRILYTGSENYKFISPEAYQDIRCTEGLLHGLRYTHKQGITCGMSVGIIDIFELIHIEETEHPELFLLHVFSYTVLAAAAVADGGKEICLRQYLQALFQLFLLGDICKRYDYNPESIGKHNPLCMRKQDQGIRLLYMDATKRFSEDKPKVALVRSAMDSIDWANERRAVAIIQEYGWLTREDVGEDAAEALFLIVQHCADTKLQQACLPKLKAAVEEDPSIAWQYAFLVDRTAMNLGKEQTYGTQKIVVDGMPYPVPIEDVDGLDTRRSEMGLETLWDELNDEYGSDWSLTKYKERVGKIEEVYHNYLQNHKK